MKCKLSVEILRAEKRAARMDETPKVAWSRQQTPLPARSRSIGILQRELDEPRITNRRVDLRQRTWVFDVRGRWIGKRRMVGQVEKLGPEQHALLFADAKGLANRQVHVRLMWSNKAIARGVAETRRAAWPDYRRKHEGSGVDKVI